jgi:hypothetical protein
MKKLLSEILTDEMLTDIFNKLKKNETYEYSDGNMQFNISPNGISIQYKSTKPENLEEIKSKKVDNFLSFCESMDDELYLMLIPLGLIQNDVFLSEYSKVSPLANASKILRNISSFNNSFISHIFNSTYLIILHIFKIPNEFLNNDRI